MKKIMTSPASIPIHHMLSKKRVGHHVSMANGISNAILNASHIGATSFALFTRSPRTWKSKELSSKEVGKWKELLEQRICPIEKDTHPDSSFHFSPKHILPHGSYLVNLGNSDEEKRKQSLDLFKEELQICNRLGIQMLNIHPGSTRRIITRDECISLIAQGINEVVKEIPNVKIVLENTAGGGGTIGNTFEEIQKIIELIEDKNRIGVCLDTCHLFAAGYDLSSAKKCKNVMEKFHSTIGFEYLSGMHINDSKVDCGSRVDRHEKLGKGKIGMECFRFIMNDDRFNDIPLILETPGDDHKNEIALLYSLEGQCNHTMESIAEMISP